MIYFIQTIICSAIFYIAFHFLFKEKNEHVFNRFYLLISLLLAVIIPLCSIPVFPEYINVVSKTGIKFIRNKEVIETAYALSWKDGLLAIYVLGILFHIIILIKRLFSIYKTIKTGTKKTSDGMTTVITRDEIPVSSFLHYLFIPKKDEQSISQYELVHEGIHIKQKHSWDILFIECIRIAFWFNPIILFYKKSIVEVHEYLADQETSKTLGQDDYEQFLALKTYTPKKQAPQLVHNFHSLFEKRIKMLNSNVSTKKWQFSLVLPIIAIALMAFSFDNYPVYNVQNNDLNLIEQDSFPPLPPFPPIPEELVGQELDTIISFDPVTYEQTVTYVISTGDAPSIPTTTIEYPSSSTGIDTLIVFDPDDFSETVIIINNQTGQRDTIK